MNQQHMKTVECDLCVIGTGIAGLNALNSASEYLSKNDRVLVVDQKPKSQMLGGMWNHVYQYVRLHQPHPLFTIGNKKWTIRKNASYLANREEILSHFKSCYQSLKEKRTIEEQFGYIYQSHEEVKEGEEIVVHIQFVASDDSMPPLMVKAKRCIKAFGFNIEPNEPMSFSTDRVHSLSPESPELLDGTVAGDDRPVYVIGGGKTSMDVASLLLSQNPAQKINYIVGKGTYFLNRDTFFPEGIKKNWAGKTINLCMLDISYRYDPQQLSCTTRYLRDKYGLAPFDQATQTFIGLLSPEEAAIIDQSIESTVYDYVLDVTETDEGLCLVYKSGRKEPIAEGSYLINCTGHIYPKSTTAEPVVSEHGRVLNIQKTASTFIFTSIAGYFLPHVWFRDRFDKVPVLYFNHEDLAKKDKESFLYAFAAQVIHNQLRFFEALPFGILYNCGLNFDKWFPLHRQLPVLADMLLNKKKYLEKTKAVIDQICEKYGVENGVVG